MAMDTSRFRWRSWKGLAVALASALLLVAVSAAVAAWRAGPWLQRQVVETLDRELDADVTLASLQLTLFPRPRVHGRELRVSLRDRPSPEPVIALASFSAAVAWTDLLLLRRHVDDVQVEDLRIAIPPRPSAVKRTRRDGCRAEPGEATPTGTGAPDGFTISRLVADGATLALHPRDPGKSPRVFHIHTLRMRDVGLARPMSFEAELTNPLPRGPVSTSGEFGPWGRPHPSLTPLKGTYSMRDADMGVFKGIGGAVSSEGTFEGVLEQIEVKGAAAVPDFQLTSAGNPVPLVTDFDVCIDGTDGDTYLDRVDARLGDTPIAAAGRVEGTAGVQGRTVAIEAEVDDGRLDDVLRLAMKGPRPFMRGAVNFTTTLRIPPGDVDLREKLFLQGEFRLARTRFTDPAVQGKLDEMSRRSSGRVKEDPEDLPTAVSGMSGRFRLQDGQMTFTRLTFAMEGARVNLRGSYGLVSEQIRFEGTVRTEAKVSEMTTGVKSALLKVFDPLLSRRNAGTVVPVEISGTREDPKFDVKIWRALTRRDP